MVDNAINTSGDDVFLNVLDTEITFLYSFQKSNKK